MLMLSWLLILLVGVVFLCVLCVCVVRFAAFVDVNPRYQRLLRDVGLVHPEDFLSLPAVQVCGHPGRNVAQVQLEFGGEIVAAYVKREHQVSWKERLVNAWAGFGFSSKSYREALTLRRLRQAGIAGPEFMAAGEDGRAQAFLLVREVSKAADLRLFLQDHLGGSREQRRRFARALGAALGRVHAAGFEHRDLYAKHVMVNRFTKAISFLDWQRCPRGPWPGHAWRWRDLAALHATLADHLASRRERLIGLRAYLAVGYETGSLPEKGTLAIASLVHDIDRRARKLLRRRRVRELRQSPLVPGQQNLIWLNGEALCMTRQFLASLNGQVPDWLAHWDRMGERESPVARMLVPLPGDRRAHLVRRRTQRTAFSGWRRVTSPEFEQARILFRLQRYGVETPQLLAVGQRHLRGGQQESFLLIEKPAAGMDLVEKLASLSRRRPRNAERNQRRQLLHQAAVLLRRLHEAACYGVPRQREIDGPLSFLVRLEPGNQPVMMLATVEGLCRRRRPAPRLARRDLRSVFQGIPLEGCGRTDAVRFLLAYLGLQRLDPAAKKLARWLLKNGRVGGADRSVTGRFAG